MSTQTTPRKHYNLDFYTWVIVLNHAHDMNPGINLADIASNFGMIESSLHDIEYGEWLETLEGQDRVAAEMAWSNGINPF